MPTGGPKDTQPPKVQRSLPDSRTLSFADNQFYIEFDEYVVLKDADNNVLVSPPLKNKPEIKTKGRGVQVKIKDTLAENTTYLFQFKDAIADFNEGNLLPSLEYVFSTGSYIDSMTVRGRVVDALTFKPREEAVSVWLMSLAEAERFMSTYGDSAAPAPKLAYATRCNKDGSFVFNYMAPGEQEPADRAWRKRGLCDGRSRVEEYERQCDSGFRFAQRRRHGACRAADIHP